MNYQEFMALCKWAKEIGIKTFGQLQAFKEECTDGTNNDLLDKISACFTYGIQMGDIL